MSLMPRLFDNAESQFRLAPWKDKILPALLACGLGLVLLYAAAFAQTTQLHNAAHDIRHAAAVPCH